MTWYVSISLESSPAIKLGGVREIALYQRFLTSPYPTPPKKSSAISTPRPGRISGHEQETKQDMSFHGSSGNPEDRCPTSGTLVPWKEEVGGQLEGTEKYR